VLTDPADQSVPVRSHGVDGRLDVVDRRRRSDRRPDTPGQATLLTEGDAPSSGANSWAPNQMWGRQPG